MTTHYHVVMSQDGISNDYFSSAYASEDEAQDALQHYVDTDLEDETMAWEWDSDDRYVDPDGEATVEVKSCDLPYCMANG